MKLLHAILGFITSVATTAMVHAQEPLAIQLVRYEVNQPVVKPITTKSAVDLSIKPLSAISLSIAPPTGGRLPANPAEQVLAQAAQATDLTLIHRSWEPWHYYWQASAFAHQPLYFEQPNLERSGHHASCLQPLLSGAHFFGTVPLLPYKMALAPCHSCQYTLGHSRPGNCNSWEPHDFRYTNCAALTEASVITGLFFLVP